MNLSVQVKENEKERLSRDLNLVLGILRRYQVKATFFVVGNIAQRYPELVTSICSDGHDIGSHSYYHKLVSRMSETEFCEDLKKSMEALGKIVKKPISSYRAPAWSYKLNCDLWFWSSLKKNGIKYDSSIFPTRNFLYGVPDAPRFLNKRDFDVCEIPPSTVRFFGTNIPFSGGFYFRLLPYWFIKMAIRAINRTGQSVVIYLHPYEVNGRLERIEGQTVLNNFIHHFKISCTKSKFENLLREFRFCSISDYFENEMIKL